MDSDRYQRHSLIEWFSQQQVREAHIAVIGAGAIGNEVIKNLALLGVGAIDIYDFDRIEAHNLTRSVLFRDEDIGRAKAAVAAERARQLDPSVTITAIEGDVWETLGFAALRACTCVVCAVDNFEARIRVNQLCRLARVDLVNAAIDSRYASVESYPFGSAQECACYECGLPPSVYQRIANRYSCGWLRRLGLVERKVPTTIITSAVSGALGASMALRLGEGEPKESATRYLLDTIGRQSTSSAIPKAPDCVGCGHIGRTTRIVPVTAGTESWLCAALPELAQATRIRVSDQIITGMRCTTCDPVERPVFARATDNDESLTVCERCGQRSVAVSIRDTFTAAELARLQGTLPVKYALVNVGATTLVMDCTRERKECE